MFAIFAGRDPSKKLTKSSSKMSVQSFHDGGSGSASATKVQAPAAQRVWETQGWNWLEWRSAWKLGFLGVLGLEGRKQPNNP